MLTLIQARGRVVNRSELLAEIWNTPFAGSDKVDAVVGSLRKKLGPSRRRSKP
jgi:DNA-binding response OmpR family regulator